MHPKKFKTGKIELKSDSEPQEKKETKTSTLSKVSKHKFNIV